MRSYCESLPHQFPSGPEPACLGLSSREALGRGGFPLPPLFSTAQSNRKRIVFIGHRWSDDASPLSMTADFFLPRAEDTTLDKGFLLELRSSLLNGGFAHKIE
jgi:hypothetical protein